MRVVFPVKSRRGLSLVEVLIVMAIIAVLTALTAGGIMRARLIGQRVQCANNLRQLGIAGVHYSLDHGGDMPQDVEVGGTNFRTSWIFQLMSYLECQTEQITPVYVCPMDPRAKDRLSQTSLTCQSSSYAINEYVSNPSIAGSCTTLTSIPSKTTTVWLITASDTKGISVYNDHAHSSLWFSGGANQAYQRVAVDVQVDRFGGAANSTAAAGRTAGSANYLFCDAHVESIPAIVMKRRCDAMENFAKP